MSETASPSRPRRRLCCRAVFAWMVMVPIMGFFFWVLVNLALSGRWIEALVATVIWACGFSSFFSYRPIRALFRLLKEVEGDPVDQGSPTRARKASR